MQITHYVLETPFGETYINVDEENQACLTYNANAVLPAYKQWLHENLAEIERLVNRKVTLLAY